MYCAVYKSSKKAETYLYLAQRDGFHVVPEALRTAFGQAQLVLEMGLVPTRKLAQEDTCEVLRALLSRGWFLQMPRQDRPDPLENGLN